MTEANLTLLLTVLSGVLLLLNTLMGHDRARTLKKIRAILDILSNGHDLDDTEPVEPQQ